MTPNRLLNGLYIVIVLITSGVSQSHASISYSRAQGSTPADISVEKVAKPTELLEVLHRYPISREISPDSVSSADNFGYTWDDTVLFDWVDATDGIIAEFNDDDDGFTEAIEIGFNFKFYENTYSSVFIGVNGLLTFGEGSSAFNNQAIPQDTPPDDIVAPFWDDLAVKGKNIDGVVYYKAITVGDSKSFVVEWHQVARYGENELLTFEVILYDNGDIIFQYENMNGTLNEATIGIEDGDGIEGLLYLHNSSGLQSMKSILFTRPEAFARTKVLPTYLSDFSTTLLSSFPIAVRNTGEVGQDVYDFEVFSSDPNWSVSLYAAPDWVDLVDSDQDEFIDTGVVQQGETKYLLARVKAPRSAKVGDFNKITISANSSKDPKRRSSLEIQTTIPASFAQAYADSQTGMHLNLNWDRNQITPKVADFFTGNTLTLESIADHNYLYIWERNSFNQSVFYSDIEYVIINRFGEVIKGVSRLTNNSEETSWRTNARFPAVSGAPDGKIGVLWSHNQFDAMSSKSRSNIYFAILQPNGDLSVGPLNITQNIAWRGEGDRDIPAYNSPQIAALQGNRFALVWIEDQVKVDGVVSDIFYAIFDTNGTLVRSATRLTESVPGAVLNIDPALAQANSSDQVLLTYSLFNVIDSTYSVAYTVLDSTGKTIKVSTILPGSSGWRSTAIQMDNGTFLIAWTNPVSNRIAIAGLDENHYLLKFGPHDLPGVDVRPPDFVSITSDRYGNAVLTWMDAVWKDYLYYALIDGSGEVITPPMIFLRGSADDPLIQTSFTGQGTSQYLGVTQAFFPLVSR